MIYVLNKQRKLTSKYTVICEGCSNLWSISCFKNKQCAYFIGKKPENKVCNLAVEGVFFRGPVPSYPLN